MKKNTFIHPLFRNPWLLPSIITETQKENAFMQVIEVGSVLCTPHLAFLGSCLFYSRCKSIQILNEMWLWSYFQMLSIIFVPYSLQHALKSTQGPNFIFCKIKFY